jgi:predicted nucleic acid-binding protein
VITLDSSALFALLNRSDPGHAAVRDVLARDHGPHIVPAGILAETACLVETRYGVRVMDSLLGDLEAGVFTLDCGERDLGRIRALANRYADLPLGCADAAVVACAERNGGAVLTLDRRDFGVVAREGTITVLPG